MRIIRLFSFLFFVLIFLDASRLYAQVNSVLGQVSSSAQSSYAGGISGDGRLIVFESNGNLATENPHNTDGNSEIFLFDYAQRRIFQITDTKSLLTSATGGTTFDNIKVPILNTRPVISNDGRWIAFGSNATVAYPGGPPLPGMPSLPPIVSTSNPGSFDANSFTDSMGNNSLTNDGNMEIWLYQIPLLAAADLSSGAEIPVTDLSAGTFIRVTNTTASRLPVAGSTTVQPVIADDNYNASINDDGNVIAFVSTRDLAPCATTPSATCGNAYPDFDNPEIYSYVRTANVFGQVSATARGTITAPIYNLNPSISGNGQRVVFLGNGNNPVMNMTGGSNSDRNDEVFVTDLDPTGVPVGSKRQLTTTTSSFAGQSINIVSPGRRISRDGRFVSFDSLADLTNESGGTNQTGFATFVLDLNAPAATAFRRVAARSTADSAISNGDILRFPTFTDYDGAGVAQTLIFSTRMNVKADGTIPATATDGLNSDSSRPAQVYAVSLASATSPIMRLSQFPAVSFPSAVQTHTGNTQKRIAMNLPGSDPGTGNSDLTPEVFYLLQPQVVALSPASFSFATGASNLAISPSPVPTPSPTPTPTPTPTPSPLPSPTPTPTPQTPPAVLGISPGMLAIVNIDSGLSVPITPATAVGSLSRSFTLPMELSGVTMTINGVSVGMKSVNQRQITFVAPIGIPSTSAGTSLPLVINSNGIVLKGNVTVVPARPDIFTNLPGPAPFGRARILNVINHVYTGEPFSIRTIQVRPRRLVPTVLRIYLTGVQFAPSSALQIRIGSTVIPSGFINSNAVLVEPGVYTIDFTLIAGAEHAGDQPVIVTATTGDGVRFESRLDDTAPRTRIN